MAEPEVALPGRTRLAPCHLSALRAICGGREIRNLGLALATAFGPRLTLMSPGALLSTGVLVDSLGSDHRGIAERLHAYLGCDDVAAEAEPNHLDPNEPSVRREARGLHPPGPGAQATAL